jgi:hypothetical protein
MTLQAVTDVFWPPKLMANAPALTTSTISASTHKFLWFGQVWWPGRGTKSIRNVAFLPGAITSAGGSTMRLSLQDLDPAAATVASVVEPDGVQDQTVDFLASAPTASTWYQTGNLSADRSVAHGTNLGVVLEFQSFAGADSFALQNIVASSTDMGYGGTSLLTAAWATVNVMPNILFVASDGTFGRLAPGYPISALNTHTLSTTTTPDEIALEFQVPVACKVEGCWFTGAVSATRNFEINLYDAGGTPLATVTVDIETVAGTTQRSYPIFFPAEVSLSANTTYRLAWKPLTTSTSVTYSASVAAAGHFDVWPGGQAWKYTQRVDGGTWDAATTTQRFLTGLIVSAIHDGAGGAGVIGVIGG